MSDRKPKYRTWDSPPYVEPKVKWPESLTDPSQNMPIEKLVDRHIRAGSPAHGLPFGDDLSRVGFTELSVELQQARVRLSEARDSEKKAAAEVEEKALAAAKAAREGVLAKLRAGSPELQAIAADLTRILPGFEASLPPPGGGGSKA